MLSRRFLRIKVLQAVYAFFQSKNDDLGSGEKQLLLGINKLYEQYIHILSFLIEIFDFAEVRQEEVKKKYFPTKEDLDPNTRFTDNTFIAQLRDNKDFRRKVDVYKINWSEEVEYVRKIYNAIRQGDQYKQYMSSPESSYKADKKMVEDILQVYISESESLESYFEDRNIFWASDYFIAIWMALKTVKMFKKEWSESKPLPGVFQTSAEEDNEDRAFVIDLFRKTIIHNAPFEQMIKERATNWEIDRIAAMDKMILKMAIAELTEFSSIPIKVSLNEYIDIAKIFSTHKSRVFINGILDKLINDLEKENKIKKSGRGLMN